MSNHVTNIVKMRSVVVYGAGESGCRVIDSMRHGHVVLAVTDCNPTLWGTRVRNYEVIPPAKLSDLSYDLIMVAVERSLEVYQELIHAGIESRKIELASPLITSGADKYQLRRIERTWWLVGLWMDSVIAIITRLLRNFANRFMRFFGMAQKESEVLVYIGPWDWHKLRNRSQPLSEALSLLGQRVFYINPDEKELKPQERISAFGRILEFLRGSHRGLVISNVLPGNDIEVVDVHSTGRRDRFNLTLDFSPGGQDALFRWLVILREKHRMMRLIVSRQIRCSVMVAIPWNHITLDIEDPWPERGWAQQPCARFAISKGLQQANLVIGNGAKTCDLIGDSYGRSIISFPNGVDQRFLKAIETTEARVPDGMKCGSGTYRVLFYGVIDGRIHLELLSRVIPDFPSIAFFFLGTTYLSDSQKHYWETILNAENCHHLNAVPYPELPDYIKACDGLLLPYSCEGADKMFPAKLLEYIASSKVIFTSLDHREVEPVIEMFRIYNDEETLRTQLNWALSHKFALRPEVSIEGKHFCSKNTWDTRATQLKAWWGA